MGSSKCYRARWIAVVSSSFRVGDTWGREKGCREAEISAPLASLEDEEPTTVSCARGLQVTVHHAARRRGCGGIAHASALLRCRPRDRYAMRACPRQQGSPLAG